MYDATAELAFLGAVILSPKEALPVARSIVRTEDIFHEGIRAAYTVVCELADAGETVDIVNVAERAKRYSVQADGKLLITCMDTAVTAANIQIYAEAVHSGAIRRRIQALGLKLVEDTPEAPEETLRDAIASLQALQSGVSAKPRPPAETAMAFYDSLTEAAAGKRKTFLSTGYKKLDTILGGGLANAGMITLAARTGIGKTTLGLNIADNVAAAGHPVLYISLEMGEEQIMARRVGRLAKLSYNKLQRGDIPLEDKETWSRIIDALSQISKRPLYISDRPATIADIELKARAVPGLELIVIDHMGILRPEKGQGWKNLYEQTTANSHAIKALALSLKIPCLTLCQLNRESKGVPDLTELRNSGAIEEDSDAVILLHRPAAYWAAEDRPKPWQGEDIDVIVAKNRHGITGKVTMNFYGMTNAVME